MGMRVDRGCVELSFGDGADASAEVIRRAREYGYRRLAVDAGVSRMHLWRWLHGRRRLSAGAWLRLSGVLGLPSDLSAIEPSCPESWL